MGDFRDGGMINTQNLVAQTAFSQIDQKASPSMIKQAIDQRGNIQVF